MDRQMTRFSSVLKILATLFLILLASCESGDIAPPTATPEWTWVSGSSTINQAGIYGTKGTAAPSNIPGAREMAVSWKDPQGKFWLFGGYGHDSAGYRARLNDLWKYDPTTNEWTWISGEKTANQAGVYGTQGQPAPANVPGARARAVSWSDSSGELWLFGGYGLDSAGNLAWLNDLWKFDPTTLEWTWASGNSSANQVGSYGARGIPDPANIPGAREDAGTWIDSSGRLWLFGGYGYASVVILGYLNDLWRYDPTTMEWTWVSGMNATGQLGSYGTKGIASPSNVPGSRSTAVARMDPQGKLWLFGGFGVDSAGSGGFLNDLWMFDPTTLEWAWISGGDSVNQPGTYGVQGIASTSKLPGTRQWAASWMDPQGDLWLFGGYGLDLAGTMDQLNDLWRYDPTSRRWNWVSGSSSVNQAGTYGIRGTADPNNVPGARQAAVSWIDSSGRLWLFGGTGLDSAGDRAWLNDLWRYSR
jgi:N-acetylneuraminic acid mutarotase